MLGDYIDKTKKFLDRNEFSLIMLKPNVENLPILSTLEIELKSYSIDIVSRSDIELSKQDIFSNFATKFDLELYSQFLCSERLKVFLVRGNDCNAKLRKIKIKIRRAFNRTPYEMDNFIHTVDLGLEHFRQFGLFFPNHDDRLFCGYADLTLDTLSKDGSLQLLEMEQNTNLSCVGIRFKSFEDITLLQEYYSESEGKRQILKIIPYYVSFLELHGNKIPLLIYFTDFDSNVKEIARIVSGSMIIEEVLKNPFIKLAMGYVPYQEIDIKLLHDIAGLGISGVVLYDERRSLYEAMVMEKMMNDHTSLLPIGGSSNNVSIGRIAVGKSQFENFVKAR